MTDPQAASATPTPPPSGERARVRVVEEGQVWEPRDRRASRQGAVVVLRVDDDGLYSNGFVRVSRGDPERLSTMRCATLRRRFKLLEMVSR